MNILEKNKLIAEFMTLDKTYGYLVLKQGEYSPEYQHFKYHESWEWLMGVVEKIEQMKVNKLHIASVVIDGRVGCEIKTFDGNFSITYLANKMEAVYTCVVTFIKYYNETYL